MRVLLTLAAISSATGCMTFGGPTKIVSIPPGATVKVEEFGECLTPCKVKIDEPRMITVAKAGYIAQRFRISPDTPTVKVRLELAAPTENVEETTLPEL